MQLLSSSAACRRRLYLLDLDSWSSDFFFGPIVVDLKQRKIIGRLFNYQVWCRCVRAEKFNNECINEKKKTNAQGKIFLQFSTWDESLSAKMVHFAEPFENIRRPMYVRFLWFSSILKWESSVSFWLSHRVMSFGRASNFSWLKWNQQYHWSVTFNRQRDLTKIKGDWI